MKKLLSSLLLPIAALSGIAAPAAAAPPDGNYYPGLNISDTNPQPMKCVVWNGTNYVSCSASGAGGPVTQASGSTPWIDNVTQFGGTNLSTGAGPSGPGIPRVTVSSDSTLNIGSAGLGSAAAPVRTDPIGATTQPVAPAANTRFDGTIALPETDIGVSIAAATATTLTTLTTSSHQYTLQNNTTGNCYWRVGAAATPDYHSRLLASGVSYETGTMLGTGILSVYCVSAGPIPATLK